MYIKSMVIDGFKSYAQRTEIVGFDNMFNAITGLNGSGKSNILDGICFVLGISNLSQVIIVNNCKHTHLILLHIPIMSTYTVGIYIFLYSHIYNMT